MVGFLKQFFFLNYISLYLKRNGRLHLISVYDILNVRKGRKVVHISVLQALQEIYLKEKVANIFKCYWLINLVLNAGHGQPITVSITFRFIQS